MSKNDSSKNVEIERVDSTFILIVGDEAAFGRVVQRRLQNDGFVCEHLLALHEARTLISKKTPSFLVLDMRLTECTGIESLEELVSPLGFSIIVLGGFGSLENAVEVMKLSASDYLSKPTDLDKFALVVEELLEKMGQRSHEDRINIANVTLQELEYSMI